jgi:hypothetical protein
MATTPIGYIDETLGPVPVTQNEPLPVSIVDVQGPKQATLSQSVVQATDAAFALKALPAAIAVASAPSNATSAAYETNRVVKNAAGVVYGVTGYNSKASAQFILLFDAIALPAEGAAPKVVITAAASSNFSIDFGAYGRAFTNGIVICNSSTGPTKTIGSADCWFDVRYV